MNCRGSLLVKKSIFVSAWHAKQKQHHLRKILNPFDQKPAWNNEDKRDRHTDKNKRTSIHIQRKRQSGRSIPNALKRSYSVGLAKKRAHRMMWKDTMRICLCVFVSAGGWENKGIIICLSIEQLSWQIIIKWKRVRRSWRRRANGRGWFKTFGYVLLHWSRSLVDPTPLGNIVAIQSETLFYHGNNIPTGQ